jgi:COP9 signalosome complex subunit 7
MQSDCSELSSKLPLLSTVQETKLKYLSLATLARSARILPYPRLQESLDIHVIRDLEDLIIDAMYQDVVRGKLDQQRSTFAVEWSMGRDTRTEDIQGILEALNNWGRMTGALLESMDNKIKKIKDEQAESESLRNKHNVILRENVKEVSEKIQTPTSNRSTRKGRNGESLFGDAMDIDERAVPGSGPRHASSTPSGSRIQWVLVVFVDVKN